MTADVYRQLDALCQALLLGGGMGVFYDLLRVLRVRLRARWLSQTLDLLFWLLATTALFLWSDRAWGGPVRLYGAAFCLLGGTVYFKLLSPLALWMGYRIADFLTVILKILLIPLSLLRMGIKKVKNIVRSTFLFRAKWYRIGQKTIAMDSAVQRRVMRKEGESHRAYETETSQPADQSCHSGTPDVSVGLSAEYPQRSPGNSAGSGDSGRRKRL